MKRYIARPSVLENLWYVIDTKPNRPKMVNFFRGEHAEEEAKNEAQRLENE